LLTTSSDELVNGLSHGVGLLAAIAATPLLVVGAVARGGAADIVGGSVFGGSLVLLYLASTAFHLTREPRRRERLRRLDHAAIYVLIAGTYTPFTLGVLGGAWGWTLFGLVWGAALIGVSAKLITGVRYPRISVAAYLLMGWLVLIAIRPLWSTMDVRGIIWLGLGVWHTRWAWHSMRQGTSAAVT
jgi:hemolysin III